MFNNWAMLCFRAGATSLYIVQKCPTKDRVVKSIAQLWNNPVYL